MSFLVVILAGTIAGGLIGYAAFWQRQNWDFHFHGPRLRGLLTSFSFAGESVFRGTVTGFLFSALVAGLAELAW